MRQGAAVVLAGVCVSGSAAGALGQSVPEAYTIVELAPPAGGTSSVEAVNNAGMAVGWSSDAGVDTALVWTPDGAAVDLGLPANFSASRAIDINDEGSILYYAQDGGTKRWFVRTPTGVDLELLAPTDHYIWKAVAMNSGGEVVGTTPESGGDEAHVVTVWSQTPAGYVGTIVADLDNDYNALAINDSGLVSATGAFQSSTGYLYNRRTGVTATYSDPGQFFDIVDVNNAGEAVYLYEELATVAAGVLGGEKILPFGCENAGPHQGACIEAAVVFAWAINEQGVAVGGSTSVALDGNGFPNPTGDPERAYIWSADSGTVLLRSLVVEGDLASWSVLTSGEDINDAGWIVGNGTKNGDPRSFLLIPREPCAGDTNRDGQVTPADFSAWVSAFNTGCD